MAMLAAGLLVLVLAQGPVPPDTPWSCPPTHPVKGYLSPGPRPRTDDLVRLARADSAVARELAGKGHRAREVSETVSALANELRA
jgi:hypothetical protein